MIHIYKNAILYYWQKPMTQPDVQIAGLSNRPLPRRQGLNLRYTRVSKTRVNTTDCAAYRQPAARERAPGIISRPPSPRPGPEVRR